jgi:diketogulonate reductase-like aldo/keto reductase
VKEGSTVQVRRRASLPASSSAFLLSALTSEQSNGTSSSRCTTSLRTRRHLSNQTVKRIAESIGRTSAQVLLRWSLQRGLVVIPKSTQSERIAENARIFDFTLTDEDMAELDALDRAHGANRALERT